MKNNLIVQIYIPAKGWEEEHRLDWQSSEVLQLSNALVKIYAKMIKAEYKLITKPVINYKHPTWERFQLFTEEWVDSYDNILYLDTDVFTWPTSPNIFDYIKNDALNVVKHCANKYMNNKPMFNAGVFCFNKEVYKNLKKYISINNWNNNFKIDPLWEDGKELNTISQNDDVKLNWLDVKWNMKNHPEAYFTHLWGGIKKINPNMPAVIKAREILNTEKSGLKL